MNSLDWKFPDGRGACEKNNCSQDAAFRTCLPEGLDQLMAKAVAAATRRSRELAG